ncbi:hypothetical protein EMIHUDRAFT_195975 [Emiliania huxleyi CCMP1516]|uniref:Uncharacterized protein n=2 Tax=Emiliania huxleyi TaxID=2903 RepID=A0A0D3J389_EMIH1|nr:hypothetical protein EMIHUDRAFT_195975 [Emiliania huxleyi CCMP1516]EOD17974.1 hypothetical protein EMIHUDRAFT_195975 [Emiliania huxleyi CCMP1516]|eukprot:XP_005770403.1 hypothetical protein EMIHUDRAFT_195975 [Emiliania huxleyi CCMP1516]
MLLLPAVAGSGPDAAPTALVLYDGGALASYDLGGTANRGARLAAELAVAPLVAMLLLWAQFRAEYPRGSRSSLLGELPFTELRADSPPATVEAASVSASFALAGDASQRGALPAGHGELYDGLVTRS